MKTEEKVNKIYSEFNKDGTLDMLYDTNELKDAYKAGVWDTLDITNEEYQELEAKILNYRNKLKEKFIEMENEDFNAPYWVMFHFDKHFGITNEKLK